MFINTDRKNQKGFSLVELMVVVAIIGILSAVAIPNFQRFQRQARQSEARALLGGLYSSQAAFRAQWETYTSDLLVAGFTPEGQLRYSVGFTAVAPVGNGFTGGQMNATGDPIGWTLPAASFNNARFSTAQVCADLNVDCTDPGLGIVGSAWTAGGPGDAGGYTAGAVGVIGGAANDQWTLTEAKVYQNTQDGTL